MIISFFGDAISPRGGVLWLSTLRPLASRLGIESGTLGAALSRLTADGWLVRDKRGRNSLYRLDATGQSAFDEAAQRIYGTRTPRRWNGRWSLVIGPSDEQPGTGYARVDTRTWARPVLDDNESATDDDGRTPGVRFDANAPASDELRQVVDHAWALQSVAQAYHCWLARFSPVIVALDDETPLDPLVAMGIRLLLVHEFRRIVLKDPDLPDELRWSDWPGFRARDSAARLYRRVMAASEAWLDAPDRTPDGPLPLPKAEFYARFGGLK